MQVWDWWLSTLYFQYLWSFGYFFYNKWVSLNIFTCITLGKQLFPYCRFIWSWPPSRAVATTLTAGGGVYIHIFLFCRQFLSKSNSNSSIWKEIRRAEHEYIIIPPPPINVLVSPCLQALSVSRDCNPAIRDSLIHVIRVTLLVNHTISTNRRQRYEKWRIP